MDGFLGAWHDVIKAFHLLAVIAWMAGMLYLPRLFVYHVDCEPGSRQSETFKVMERRLLKGIINPAMIAAFAFGIMLILDAGWALWSEGWWLVKAVAFLAMSAVHGWFVSMWRAFAEDRNRHTSRFFRVINEAPTVLLIIIVFMVVVRPF